MAAKTKAPGDPETTAMHHPEGIGCTAWGTAYEADADGNVHVPPIVVSDLESHGFVVVEG